MAVWRRSLLDPKPSSESSSSTKETSRLSLQLPMVSSSSSSASRPRRRLSLLKSNRPHTLHDSISRPYAHAHQHQHHHHNHQHTAHRTTTAFTPPIPHTKPRSNWAHLHAQPSLKLKPRRQDSLVRTLGRPPHTGTPPPTPLVTTAFGLRLERAFSRSSRSPTPQPVTPELECDCLESSAPNTLRSDRPPGLASASSVSLASPESITEQRKGHRRTLSNKVRTLLVGLIHRRRDDEGFQEEEEEDGEPDLDSDVKGTVTVTVTPAGERAKSPYAQSSALEFGAPLRPHRSPGAASFQVTTKLTPTRSSSPPSRNASFVSRDSSVSVRPRFLVRPRTRRALRLPDRFRRAKKDNNEGDDEAEGNDSDQSDNDEDDDSRGMASSATASQDLPGTPLSFPPRTLLSHRPDTSFSLRPATAMSMNPAGPSVNVERPSMDSVRPSMDVSAPVVDRLARRVSNDSRNSRGSRASLGPSINSSRLSLTYERNSPRSMDTARSLTLSESKSVPSVYKLGTTAKTLPENPVENAAVREALESRFSDTSDSEDEHSVCGELVERERPTSPFRRPFSSMPDLVRDQLRALANRRGNRKSLDLE